MKRNFITIQMKPPYNLDIVIRLSIGTFISLLRKMSYKTNVFITSILICLFSSIKSFAWGELNCGMKPIANLGCTIGKCLNGKWEQICETNPQATCGLRPYDEIGCKIGSCVNGTDLTG